jgi:hypothetical protein
MKNVIIVVLALLSVFLGYKAYFSPKASADQADAKSSEEEEVSETYAVLMEQGFFDVESIDPNYGIDANKLVEHFHKHTLKKLKDGLPLPGAGNGTDGLVTSSVEFSKETLKAIMDNDDELFVRFYLGAFDRESAKKYALEHGLTIREVVQKPVVIAKSKGKTVSNPPISAIGKICPPPRSCP